MTTERLAASAQTAKPTAVRAEIVEPLFAHTVAERVLFQTGSRSIRGALPA
jgi:hypothetical protein